MKTLLLHTVLTVVLSYIIFINVEVLPYNATTAGLVFILLFMLLWLTSWLTNKVYFRKLPKAIGFLFYFLMKVFIANIKIAYDILTPEYKMEPTVVAFPLTVKSDIQITFLACVVTLTPGSLSLDVSDDKKLLYIHALYLKNNDADEFKAELKNGFERRIIELTA
jgi:multicomponent Na+:H+ antiporter subunit E